MFSPNKFSAGRRKTKNCFPPYRNNDIIPKLESISSLALEVYDEEIPGQLLRYAVPPAFFRRFLMCLIFALIFFARRIIDEGKNPDLYTKELLEECVRRNERTKGKFEAIQVRRWIHRQHPDELI